MSSGGESPRATVVFPRTTQRAIFDEYEYDPSSYFLYYPPNLNTGATTSVTASKRYHHGSAAIPPGALTGSLLPFGLV
jgi:hypothetical protein